MTKFIGLISIDNYNELIITKTIKMGEVLLVPMTMVECDLTTKSPLTEWDSDQIGIVFDTSHIDSVVARWSINKSICTLQNTTPLRIIESIEDYREVMEDYKNE